MTSIVRYRKHITAYTVIELHQPETEQGEQLTTELATLDDGYTYVAVPDGVVLPVQPDEVKVESVSITEALREQIKLASPHVRLINDRVVQKIRKRYTKNDEIKYGMLSVNVIVNNEKLTGREERQRNQYLSYRHDCVAWGRAEKIKLGME